MDNLTGRLSGALAALGDRERRILNGRLALEGQPPQSLEALGAELAISRERVRQIEHKALAETAARLSAASIAAAIEAGGDAAWRQISRGTGYLRRADLMIRRLDLAPDFRLMLALAQLPVAAWLHRAARAYGNGWCDRSVTVRSLNRVARRLALRLEGRRSPASGPGDDLDPVAVRIVMALLLDQPSRYGRMPPGRERRGR